MKLNPTSRQLLKAATLLMAASACLVAQRKKAPELTGTIAFDVDSRSGRVETMEVVIGDGGAGPYKAVLTGAPSLPTHAIYRPRNLQPFSKANPLPVVAFANGGCRNTSGEFRNFLSDIASHGFLVVSIGPAGNSVVMGSEERTNTTNSSQLLDGVNWAIAENDRDGGDFYQKIAVSRVAVMGQSCGGGQAVDVSLDPRVTTTVVLNQGVNMSQETRPLGGVAGQQNRGTGAAAAPDRYAPFAPTLMRAPVTPDSATPIAAPNRVEILGKLHAPILFLNGGPKDSGFANAKANFEFIQHVPVALAHQDVGHYPATYRQPNGGAFAKAVGAWLQWQLKGNETARKMFAGDSCGLCKDPSWTLERKKIN